MNSLTEICSQLVAAQEALEANIQSLYSNVEKEGRAPTEKENNEISAMQEAIFRIASALTTLSEI